MSWIDSAEYEKLVDEKDHALAEVARLRAVNAELLEVCRQIEKISWREGEKFKSWLIECRVIARKAIISAAKSEGAHYIPRARLRPIDDLKARTRRGGAR